MRSSDRYRIPHLIQRNPNFKMESYWEWLPPELQEKMLKLKENVEHRDIVKALVKEIGEFCLQSLPEDGHQGDSCCFLLSFFSRRKASHLSLDNLRSHRGHQATLQNQTQMVPVFLMWAISPCGESKN